MRGDGDSDLVAYVIAAIGGLVGGFIGSGPAVLIGAFVPTFVYQLGLDLPDNPSATQIERGLYRIFIPFFASVVPAIGGLVAGGLIILIND